MWGDRFVSGSALTTRIKSARQAVGDDGQRQHVIRTVHGKGYEFVADVRVVDGVGVGVESATDASSRTAAAGPIRSAVPPALHALVGREALLQLLEHEMTTTRVVTLVGTGGVGKTTVAYELARRLGGNYRDGNYVVALSTMVDEDATGEALATALDVYTPQSTSIEDAIVDMLRARRALLVIDNCEHLVEPVAALVGRILGAAPELSILATSREALVVNGEHVWTVEPLDTGTGSDVTGHDLARCLQSRCSSSGRVRPIRCSNSMRSRHPPSSRSAAGSMASPWPSSSPRRERVPSTSVRSPAGSTSGSEC